MALTHQPHSADVCRGITKTGYLQTKRYTEFVCGFIVLVASTIPIVMVTIIMYNVRLHNDCTHLLGLVFLCSDFPQPLNELQAARSPLRLVLQTVLYQAQKDALFFL